MALGTGAWVGLVALDQLYVEHRPRADINPLIVAWQAVICALLYLAMSGAAYAARNAERVREESARSARAEALRARAELAALRTQLNPHFLLNTLHTLLGLVRREPALAERALERLGELMYYGLRLHRQGVDQVSLREEWDFVSGYLDIERLRMGDRLRLELDGEADAMDCLVPPFALQPLVENAVLHGIAPAQGGRAPDGDGAPVGGPAAPRGLRRRPRPARRSAATGSRRGPAAPARAPGHASTPGRRPAPGAGRRAGAAGDARPAAGPLAAAEAS